VLSIVIHLCVVQLVALGLALAFIGHSNTVVSPLHTL